MTEFEGVVPALGQALTKRGYTELTPVQTSVLAEGVSTSDVLVSAQTGSGKTVAFGLTMAPTLLDGKERFEHADAPLALVVAPTRELALQVKGELIWLYQMTGANIASCVGGMDMRDERRALQRGAHIVVGTPGRLRDHIERNSLNTSAFKAVVLDEADEMLDMGFRDDLEYILDSAPKERRTLMFSATVPHSIANMAKRYQRDAVRISTAAERSQHDDIEYRALTVAPNDRENAIVNVLRFYEAKNALVFCSTRAAVNRMTSRYTNRGFSVVALSGELSQNERTHALQAMRDGRARICIATDVAARGLDLPNLELVIHADLPRNREALLHRSGRTGRAGRKGVCTLIVPYNERRRAERLLQSGNVKATWAKPPSIEDITKRDHERILEDPALIEPVSEGEQPFAQELANRHSAEQIAAAFLRLYRKSHTAPEELIDSGPAERPERKGNPRDDFKNGVWFTLSVGHKHNAEARWLIPMLCRAGHLTKRDIGAIKVQASETHVELAPDCVERVLEAIGPEGMVEKTISMTRMKGAPPAKSDSRPYANKRPHGGGGRGGEHRGGEHRGGGNRGNFESKRKFERRPDEKRPAPREERASSTAPAERPAPRTHDEKPYEKKKPYTARRDEARNDDRPERKFERKQDEPRSGGKFQDRGDTTPKGKKPPKKKFSAKLQLDPNHKPTRKPDTATSDEKPKDETNAKFEVKKVRSRKSAAKQNKRRITGPSGSSPMKRTKTRK